MESASRKELSVAKLHSLDQNSPVVRSRKAILSAVVPDLSNAQIQFQLLQEILGRLKNGSLTLREFTFELQSFFEILIRGETGLFGLRQGLIIFIDKLCAEPYVVKILQKLFREMQKLIKNIESKDYNRSEAAQLVEEVFNWYLERRTSIDQITARQSGSSHYDFIYDLRVFHDRLQCGVKGFEVTAGLALFGRAGQNLWLKVFVRQQGAYVLPRVEWNSWIDDTEIFTVPKSGLQKVGIRKIGEANALSAIVPITPSTQRQVIDRVTAFIPYAALDLGGGKHEMEIEACVFNEYGDQILDASISDVIGLSRNKSTAKLVSNQALGLWPKDFVSGDAVSNLEIDCLSGENSKNKEIVKFSFDLDLIDRMGEEVVVECRFYRPDGGIVACKGNSADGDNSVREIAVRKPIKIEEIAAHFVGFEINLPLAELDLQDDDQRILCELCVLSSDSRVICGTLAALDLPANYEIRNGTANDSQPQKVEEVSNLKSKLLKFFRLNEADSRTL